MTDKIIELCRRMFKWGWEECEFYNGDHEGIHMPSDEEIQKVIKDVGIDSDIQTYYKVKDSIT